jgi:tRNA pseudouridine13 synthase
MPRTDLITPYLTAHLPGIGGRIKVECEDFEVEEIPSYEPSGDGEHLFLWIQKEGVGPEHFTKTIAQRLGIAVGAVGTAGLKDRYSVSRQWVSVPKECEKQLSKVDGEGYKILKATRHNNKLRPGHLRGNTFRILIRDANRNHAAHVETILQIIREHGLPNYYGPQRFGRGGETADLGFRCLTGQQKNRLRPFLFKFAISAAQSVLFNRYLALRQRDGLLRTVMAGDVMMKWPFGGLFVAEDISTEQARFDARETVTGGPMFGSRTFAAKEIAAERESKILQESGLSTQTFDRFSKLATGTRRHNLVYIEDLKAEWENMGLRLNFSLPSGSYATVLLAEIMKVDLSERDEDNSDD